MVVRPSLYPPCEKERRTESNEAEQQYSAPQRTRLTCFPMPPPPPPRFDRGKDAAMRDDGNHLSL